MTPVSTSATWNSVGTLEFLAPPSTQITSANRQSLPSSTITQSPALNRHSAAKPKGKRLALPLDLNELPEEGARVLKQLESGLIKLPTSIRNAKDYKACGDYFRQYLDRHPYWLSLKAEVQGLVPYSLRHGYAWRGAKYYDRSIPIRDLAALMGHTVKPHMKHYGKWTDDEGLLA